MPAEQPAPKISVVISAYDAGTSVGRCLEGIRDSSYDGDFDVTVVDSTGDDMAAMVAERFPEAKLHVAPGRLFPGEARNLGLAASDGEIVLFVDAHCVPAPDLLGQVSRAHHAPTAAIGGVVENGDPRATGWAYYFCNLAKWMPRREAQEIGDLPSECLSIKRWALDAYGPFLAGTYSSATAFSWKLNAAGHQAWVDPSMRVARVDMPSFRELLSFQPGHARWFARVRAKEQEMTRAGRFARAALAPAVPFLLLGRTARSVFRNGRYRARFVATAPLVFAGFCMWAYGEAREYASRPA